MRLDGDEMAADADDGDAGHFSGTYMAVDWSRTPFGEDRHDPEGFSPSLGGGLRGGDPGFEPV
jgi:hypothetical protein